MGTSGKVFLLVVCAVLTVCAVSAAQENPQPLPFAPERPPSLREVEPAEDHVETDRDSFTPSTRTAGRGRTILEASYSFIDNRNIPETHSYPELLTRFGVTKWLELRLGWNYEIGAGGNVVSGAEGEDVLGPTISSEARLLYGFKAALTEQDRWVPESALIVQATTPTVGKATDTHLTVGYVFGWELPRHWKLDSSLRYASESEEDDRFSVWAPSVVLRVPLGERWNAHAEYFSEFSRDKAEDSVQHFFSPGLHYLITTNLEVGFRVGWGLNDQSARFFSNVGVGWRF